MAAALIVTNTSNEDILLSVQGDIVQQKPCNIIFPIARGW